MIDLGGRRPLRCRARRLANGVVAGLVFALALGGCGGDDSDDPPDSGLPSKDEVTTAPTTDTPTASPTDAPTETTGTEPSPPTSLPAAVTKPGRSGAKAFVKF
jgi:hypothetical protein